MSFGVSAALLCLLAIAFVVAPLFLRGGSARSQSGQPSSGQERRAATIAIARARLRELDEELAAGALDAAAHAQLKLEQERRLLEETAADAAPVRGIRGRWLLAAVAVMLPLAAGAFYFHNGAWSDRQIQQLLQHSERQLQAGEDNRSTLEELAGALERRLQRRDDPGGQLRFMLARLYIEFGRYPQALVQYAALREQFPQDAGIAGQYAQALYMAAGRKLTPEAAEQAQAALRLDPDQTTALGLLGIDAFERQDYAQALLHWRHLVRVLPAGSANAALIERGIEQAEQKLGADGLPGPKIVAHVTLAPELAAAVPPGATVFVFARAVGGSPMPLAVVKMDAGRLPVDVTLDDSMAMAPGMNLSSASQVEVVARITASGQVRAEAGDLESVSAPLTLDPKRPHELKIQINRKL